MIDLGKQLREKPTVNLMKLSMQEQSVIRSTLTRQEFEAVHNKEDCVYFAKTEEGATLYIKNLIGKAREHLTLLEVTDN